MRRLIFFVLCLSIVTLNGCALFKARLIVMPVTKYEFLTKANDVLLRKSIEPKEILLPVDGSWLSTDEIKRYQRIENWAIDNGFKPQ